MLWSRATGIMVGFAGYNSSDVKFYTHSSLKSERFCFFFSFTFFFFPFKLDIGRVQGEWTTEWPDSHAIPRINLLVLLSEVEHS